jgi:hypothetical protein
MKCAEKKRHLSKDEAKRFARLCRQHGRKKQRAYHCRECGFWHLSTTDAASRAFHRRGERVTEGA